ncbi:hypothetical protein CLM85_16105 [Streptomyces albidoflavus]|uniref:DUF6114 domain-containing protein n=1 Tax=Streptomyces albidoflavus TaxID=1886 RepID=UPI000BADF5B9|nr:DUF6114 domain-containing protein [Streptomyces albidoflavus]MBF4133931.1 hypothetical protein [Streptomyces albidoflavus]PAX81880.1 hypothetical protein CLM81_31050 [Streptomyces albidoflavus]PAX87722.1 hypothetical protein CLM82_25820 [Streptomyces albidoflavus]PBO17480.1 hypothetical protein CLM83_17895 [Streptomyces albidoflavus]PBO23436.1 hypothetical protein CLM85_16105 [Streptomyces albidoflavus]
MSAESPGLSDRFHYWRLRFRVWRGSRPFWAGLLTMLGGIPIAYLPYAQLTLGQLSLRMATTAGAGSLIIGVLLVTLGLTMWFQSIVRVFAGVAAILLALVSIPVSNLGGLLIGFLLAMFGGALSISWAPGKTAPEGSGQGAQPAGTRTRAEPETEPAGPVVQAGAPRPEPHAGGESAPADGTTLETNGGRHRAG